MPPVRQPKPRTIVSLPYSWRVLLNGWKWLRPRARLRPMIRQAQRGWNRGAYLVTTIGALRRVPYAAQLARRADPRPFPRRQPGRAATASKVPNITPDAKAGIGNWSADDIVTVLTDGTTPNFDEVGGSMAEVVRNTARLSEEDRRAIAVYLQSVPPVSGPKRK